MGRLFTFFVGLLSVSVSVAQVPVKIACVGNSITYGYGLADRSRSYPGVLQDLLGESDYTVGNFGVNSVTVSKNGNLPYWTRGMMEEVFSFQPDIVTVMLGTNDTKPENWEALGYGAQFKTDYEALIDTFVNMSSAPAVYPVLPVPVFSNPTSASWGIRDSVMQRMLPVISEVAEVRGLSVIDCNTPLSDFPEYFAADGVHPDAAGEDTMAHVIYRALTATGTTGPAAEDTRPDVHRKSVAVNSSIGPYNINGTTGMEVFDLQGKRINSRTVNRSGLSRVSSCRFRGGVYLLRLPSSEHIQKIFYRR